jgi:hypothetical protein
MAPTSVFVSKPRKEYQLKTGTSVGKMLAFINKGEKVPPRDDEYVQAFRVVPGDVDFWESVRWEVHLFDVVRG